MKIEGLTEKFKNQTVGFTNRYVNVKIVDMSRTRGNFDSNAFVPAAGRMQNGF